MSTLRGAAPLARLALRLDRVRLPVWVLGIVALVVLSATSVKGLYSTPAELATYASVATSNPTAIVVNGPGFGLDPPTLGAVIATETLVWAALTTALMSVFLVIRHTRAEEEAERAEVLRARMVGRHAPLAAAVGVVAATCLTIGLLLLGSLVAVGLPVAGSVALAGAVVGSGLVFTGIGAVAAQLTSTDRSALGWGVGAVGASYALRAVGDVGNGLLSWLSPLGWAHRVRPFAGEQWWVLGLFAVLAAALLALAVTLADRRDLGSGVLATRAGPAHGARWSRSPLGLTLRLQRGAIAGWAAGLVLLGVLYGAVGSDVEDMFADNPDLADYIALVEGASLVDSYVAYTLLLGAMLSSGFAIASVLHLRTEEAHGRTEMVLATRTGRTSWIVAHLATAIGGSATLLVAYGLGTGIGLALTLEEPGQVVRMTGASLVYLPAVLVMAGVGVLLHGLVPRAALATWAAFGAVLVVGLLADLLDLPMWIRDVSPFQHVPTVPAVPLDLVPLAALTATAVALMTVGAWAHRRRDVPAA